MTIKRPQLIERLKKLHKVTMELTHAGFNVVAIDTAPRIPQIILIESGHCKGLVSTSYKTGHDQFGRYQIFKAEKDGCELVWKTRCLQNFESHPDYH